MIDPNVQAFCQQNSIDQAILTRLSLLLHQGESFAVEGDALQVKGLAGSTPIATRFPDMAGVLSPASASQTEAAVQKFLKRIRC